MSTITDTPFADLFEVARLARDTALAACVGSAEASPASLRSFGLAIHLQTVIAAYAAQRPDTADDVIDGDAADELLAEVANALAAAVIGVAQQYVPAADGVELSEEEAVAHWMDLIARHVARRLPHSSRVNGRTSLIAQPDGSVAVRFRGTN